MSEYDAYRSFVHVQEFLPDQCIHLGGFTSVWYMRLDWNFTHTIDGPEFALSEIVSLTPLLRVRPRRRKSYIPGTAVRAADR